MSRYTLDEALGAAHSPVEFVRSLGPHANPGHLRLFADLPSEFTNWREEQAAWKESCALADLSHHMYDLRVEGHDALDLFADVGVNDFTEFQPGKAKQFVACNPDGYLVGDGILFYLAENTFDLVGYAPVNWVQYNAETGDYDVSTERNDHGGARDGTPATYRYQVQGPDALAVIREAIDGPLPDVSFFNFEEIAIDGHPCYALRHGMMDEPGFEVFGPWEHADGVRDALLSAGREHGMRRIGARAYPTNVIPTAWVALPVPAIYGEGMADYREWLDAGCFEGAFTVGGSFEPDDVSDYYLDPIEVGYGGFVDFDRDFIGRDALREREENQRRTKVTLVWDGDDVTEVFGGLFHGDTAENSRYIELPTPNWALSMYDRVLKEGEPAGVAIAPRYLYFERTMFSLGVVDTDLAEPGTEVTLVWGEAGESSNPRVEPHDQKEIRAAVAPAPYFEDKRKTADYTAG